MKIVDSLIKFAIDIFIHSWKGSLRYYAWLGFLGFFVLLFLYGNFRQLTEGMIVTGLTDQITWGVYESNLVFLVGVAAAAVTVVFPAYVYHHKEAKEAVVFGEIVAISAVSMVLLFVVEHMGRLDRAWHMIPSWVPVPYLHGIFNWPNSMLAWDVIVLNGYLALNAFCVFYYLYCKYTGREVNKLIYLPVVYVAIVWALSIHTVTAFLINTLPARPAWHHSVMPIRFISTAFAAGPALIIIAFIAIRNYTTFRIDEKVISLLTQIVIWCLGIALFLTLSEVVTEYYGKTEHSLGLQYLMFGYNGLTKLVGWFWSSLFAMMAAFVLLLIPAVRKNYKVLPYVCALAFIGIWIEKGMGLVLPAMTPTPVGEFTEYVPSHVEIFNTLGIWAIGIMMFTMLTKVAIGILRGEIRYRG